MAVDAGNGGQKAELPFPGRHLRVDPLRVGVDARVEGVLSEPRIVPGVEPRTYSKMHHSL